MRLDTPPVNQGQIVDVSYGWDGGVCYRRTHDRSDNTTTWARLSDAATRKWLRTPGATTWEFCNGPPDVPANAWVPCAEPA